MRTSQRTGVSTFASRTSPSTDQSLQKSFHLSHADKIELKKISSPSENKKYPTAQPDTTKTEKRSIDNGLQGRTTRTTGYNTGLAKVAVQCSADTFVVNQNWFSASTFVVKNATFAKPENVICHFRTTQQ
jgi:hypothetical protein